MACQRGWYERVGTVPGRKASSMSFSAPGPGSNPVEYSTDCMTTPGGRENCSPECNQPSASPRSTIKRQIGRAASAPVIFRPIVRFWS
jgi:hypothetical protein